MERERRKEIKNSYIGKWQDRWNNSTKGRLLYTYDNA